MKKKITITLSIVLIIFIYVFFTISPIYYSGSTKINSKKIVVTGHRGAAGLAPENTLASIKKAMEYKIDRVEIDIQQTKDSVVIVLHDKTLDRTTDGKGIVKDLNYNEILKYSAGVKFDEKFKNEKVPTLEQVLKLIDGKTVLVIEIKAGNEYYQGIERRTIDLIKKYSAYSWVIVHSFNDKALEKVHEIDPIVELHKLFVGDLPLLPFFYDLTINTNSLEDYDYVKEISFNYPFATKRVIDKIHKMGKKINLYTVNDSLKALKLINLGVDGIITDYPNNLRDKK